MSDREATHPPPPVTALAPAATSDPKPHPSTSEAAASPPDLVGPTTFTPSDPPPSPDLEEEEEMELLDWDEDDADAPLMAGMEAAEAGIAVSPTLADKISKPIPGNLASNGVPKQSDLTPPSRAGPEGKARAGTASDAHPGSPYTALQTPAASSTASCPAMVAAPPLR